MESFSVPRNLIGLFALFFLLASSGVCPASEISSWLLSHQNDSGAFWVPDTGLSTTDQSTHESVTALILDGAANQSSLQKAVDYLSANTPITTESIARLIMVQQNLGKVTPLTADILNRQNADGGFGSYDGYESDPVSTAFALRTLPDQNVSQIASSVSYLLGIQDVDGSWHLTGYSNSEITSEIILSLAPHLNLNGVTSVLARAKNFLFSQKNADNLWGTSADSALAISALTVGVNSGLELQASLNALMARMNAGNNWHGDVYTTALALQAINRVQSLTKPDLGEGSVIGQVLLAGSTQPIVGANVVIQGTELAVTTNAQGKFIVNNVPATSQTVLVSQPGYSSVSAAALVKNAVNTDLGQIALGPQASVSAILGNAFDASTQQPVSGAAITLTGSQAASVFSQKAGDFQFLNLPGGSYTLTINAPGYYQIQRNLDVSPGVNSQINQPLVKINTPLVSTPLVLSGRVIDGQSGETVSDIQVSLDSQDISSNRGQFSSDLVARGAHVIQIIAKGYLTGTYQVNIPSGASGDLGNLKIYKATQANAPTTLDLLTTIIDKVTGKPISGATIALSTSGASAVTDDAGDASLSGISQLQIEINVSATGYDSRQLQLNASAFGTVAITLQLSPAVPAASSWSVSGSLSDEVTREPIVGANLSINDGQRSTTTDSQGQYQIANLDSADVTLDIDATGYQSRQQHLTLGDTKGTYVVDLALTPAQGAGLNVMDINTAASVVPNSEQNIQVEVNNQGSTDEQVLMVAKIINNQGEEVATLMPYLPNSQVLSPHVQFAAGQKITLNIPWAVKQTPLGDYVIRVDLVALNTITRALPRGHLLASGHADVQVEGVALFGGAINIAPPLSQAGATTPIQLTALLRNQGNMPLPAGGYALTVTNKDNSEVYFSAAASGDALNQNQIGRLDFGSWTPKVTELGNMDVHIVRQDGIEGKIKGSIYIGDVAKASYILDRSILPLGNSSIKGKINLTGIDTKITSSVDPLFVLVKGAIEKGAEFTGPSAMRWQKYNQCMGCHIQAQTLAGLGSALNKTNISQLDANYFLNEISTGLRPDGAINTHEDNYGKRSSTVLSDWALAQWQQGDEVINVLLKGMGYVWSIRTSDSQGTRWSGDIATGWLKGDLQVTALTEIAASRAQEIIGSGQNLPVDYQWAPKGFSSINIDNGDNVIKVVGSTMYVAKPNGRMEAIDLNTNSAVTLFTYTSGVSGRMDGLELDDNGNFLLATEQGAVVRVDQAGKVINSYKVCPNRTAGLTKVPDNGYYVSCDLDDKIYHLSDQGEITLVASGGLLSYPNGMAWSPDGYLLISNWIENQILKMTPDGQMSIYSDGLSSRPFRIALSPTGDLYAIGSKTKGENVGLDIINKEGQAKKIIVQNFLRDVTVANGRVYVSEQNSPNINMLDTTSLDTSVVDKYIAEMPQVARYFLSTFNIDDQDNINQASRLIGLAEARKHIEDEVLLSQIDAAISQLAELLKSRQSTIGGWSVTGIADEHQTDSNKKPDPMITALVGLAMEYTSPSNQDPMIRNSITYLLNNQLASGAWHTNTGLFTTELGSTSLVMVYMPKALDRIGGLDIKLNLQQPNDVRLSNPSIIPDSVTPNSDGTTAYQWDIKGVTGNGRELTFDLAVNDLQLNSLRPVSSFAIMSFSNSFTDETISSQLTVPSVSASSKQSLSIQTDKASYGANEPVAINNIVNNLAQSFAGGNLQLSIKNPTTGDVITSLPVIPVNSLAESESVQLPSQWNTGSLLAGQYTVYGQLIDAQGKPLAEGFAPFAIGASIAQGDALIHAGLTTDRMTYRLGETAILSVSVDNLAQNQLLNASLGRLTVFDNANNPVFTQELVVPQLTSTSGYAHSALVSLAGLPAGKLHANWDIYDASGTQLLASATAELSIQSDPLFSLSGTASVNHIVVEQGEVQTCDYTVNNTSDANFDSLVITRTLASIDSGAEKASNQNQLNLLPGAQQMYTQAVSTSNYDLGEYACILQAQLGDNTKVLATAIFKIKDAPIKLNGALSLGDKGRLLVLVDPQKPELDAYLNNLLTQTNWYYTLVDNASDFETELNTNSYSVYALFSQTLTLPPSTREQLKTNVARGDGLLVADGHDRRHKSLEEALGVRVHAKQALIDGLSVDDSPLGEAWNYSFGYLLNSLTFDKAGASVFGHYQLARQNPANLAAFGEASSYNLFVLNDFTSMSSTVEGRMAIGGNLDLNNFSVGDKLSSGYHDSVVTVGGDVNFPSGRIYYGSLIAGGGVDGVGDAVRYGMDKKASITGHADIALDFDADRDYLKALSSNLAKLPVNGTVTLQWGNYYSLQGDCQSNLQVFNVNAAELANVRTYDVGCIPKNATVVFNILGSTVSIQNIGMQSLDSIRDHVLFNFPQAASVSLKGVAIEGSILAPYAEFDQPAGRVEGQVIARAWHSTDSGYMSIHNYPFVGNLTAAMPAPTSNALAYYQYQQGSTLFAGFDLLNLAYVYKKQSSSQVINPFEHLMMSALQRVNPPIVRMEPGKAIPLHIQIANASNQPADANAQLSMDKGFEMLLPNGFTQNQAVEDHGEWNLPIQLAPAEQIDKTLYIRLSDAPANDSDVNLDVTTGVEPNTKLQFRQTLRLINP